MRSAAVAALKKIVETQGREPAILRAAQAHRLQARREVDEKGFAMKFF